MLICLHISVSLLKEGRFLGGLIILYLKRKGSGWQISLETLDISIGEIML